MNWPITVDVLSMIVSLGAGLFIAHHWPPRPLVWAVPCAIASAFLFALGDLGARLFATQPTLAWTFTLCLYIGLTGVVYFWWVTTLGIAQIQGIRLGVSERSSKHLPLVVLTILIALIATNPWHGQFLSLFVERNEYHALWYVYAAFTYALVSATMILAVYLGLRARSNSDRWQAIFIFVGSALPPIANLAYVIPATAPIFDPTQVSVAICEVLFITAIYRDRIYAASAVPLEQVLNWDTEPTLLMDTDGRLIHANFPAYELFGPQLSVGHDVIGPISGLLMMPSDLSTLHHLQNPEVQFEEHYRSFETPHRWLRLEAKPVRPSKIHIGTIIRLCDETEKVHADESRNELESFSLLQNIFETTENAICVTGEAHEIRYANAAFLRFSSAIKINIGDSINDIFSQFDELVDDGVRFTDDLVSIHDDPEGTINTDVELSDGRFIEKSSTPLPLDHGLVRGRLWQCRDVTLQRRAEEALRDSHVLESLGSMAAGVAHDFNNLLAAVLGNAELAAVYLGSEPERARETLLRISEAAEKGSHMTHQLLSYTGKAKNSKDIVNLSELGEDIISFFDSSIDSNIVIKRDFAVDLPPVRGDASQLGQVLMNLIINARDAIGELGGRIEVTTGDTTLTETDLTTIRFHGKVKAGRFSFIEIRDNGYGMDKDTLSKMFDPFFSTKETGRGLGLAATLGITKAHNGVIKVDSAIKQGTQFTLFLPIAEQQAYEEKKTTAVVKLDAGWRSQGKALLADDNGSVRKVIKEYLLTCGFNVIEVQSGEEAIRAWDQHQGAFEIAILDLTMPGMSGQELARKLRQQKPDLPVLLISGYTQDPIPDLEMSGITSFIAKPFRLEAFVAALRKITFARGDG